MIYSCVGTASRKCGAIFFKGSSARTSYLVRHAGHAWRQNTLLFAPSKGGASLFPCDISDAHRRGFFTTKNENEDQGEETPEEEVDDDGYITGVVKMYKRRKAFGFVTTEEDPPREIYINRRSIHCAQTIEESGFRRPFLIKGEKVIFKVIPVDNGPTPEMAIDLRFEGNEPVPLYREDYLSSVKEGEVRRFGERVFAVMSNPLSSRDAKLNEIQKAMETAQQNIKAAESNVEKQETQTD